MLERPKCSTRPLRNFDCSLTGASHWAQTASDTAEHFPLLILQTGEVNGLVRAAQVEW